MGVEAITGLPGNVVGITATGTIRGSDYERVIDPAVAAALGDHEKIRFLYVFDEGFEGFADGAAWEDGKLGFGHLTKFEKIAFVADNDWMRHAVNAFGYVIPGKVKVFELAERAAATDWIQS